MVVKRRFYAEEIRFPQSLSLNLKSKTYRHLLLLLLDRTHVKIKNPVDFQRGLNSISFERE
ncbi:hypothetical protein LEP1GSC168_1271 [Leptospira santarosai str. HAI134]|uniref:Uncharacterized protein n=1 Tax=Leptospira santarosai TaxID=28183 RepID=A0AB73NAJ7_9LEPT|nr:hypothetical protein B2G51_14510 [Leptospira santarosai]EKS06632.1 hypothetical protein LEP1GSC071_0125 [Leptospira santarosai str. JET]EMM78340.1 hypothetical protein LEP1GSC040_2513 [Leptospira santarosai str. 2000030832]EMO21393.1 hypothetical protein LEP1GSC168_1271 [Leptospira santarosai str. HAI134]OLY62930.1 hypothetical protein BWD11_17315 [Leptospira santarosai serovar Grippotyphosa]ONF77136.1 hypothetical protein BWD12_16380 [Leptospira santarosai serovar Bananal]